MCTCTITARLVEETINYTAKDGTHSVCCTNYMYQLVLVMVVYIHGLLSSSGFYLFTIDLSCNSMHVITVQVY